MIKELWCVYKILKWHKKTFPKETFEDQRKKLEEEINEYLDAVNRYKKDKRKAKRFKAEMELADVLIAGVGMLRFKKARSDMDDKMVFNRIRTWNKNHHVGVDNHE